MRNGEERKGKSIDCQWFNLQTMAMMNSIILCLLSAVAIMITFAIGCGLPIFIIVGDVLTSQHVTRGLTDTRTECLVHSSSTYLIIHTSSSGKNTVRTRTYHAAMWIVYHGENKSMQATIKGTRRFDLQFDAIKETTTYKVCMYDSEEKQLCKEKRR